MSLSNNILSLRDRVLSELDAAHDYYTWSKNAWKILHLYAKTEGAKFTFRNLVTNNTISDNLLIEKSRGYVVEELPEATFQQFLSLFEVFLFDFFRIWLGEFPKSLQGKQVAFQVILESTDKDSIIGHVIESRLLDLFHKQPRDWFKYLDELANLGGATDDDISRLAEAKASRDLLVHNRGIVNDAYLSKAGNFTRFSKGVRIEISESYHRDIWLLLRKLVDSITTSALNKFNL